MIHTLPRDSARTETPIQECIECPVRVVISPELALLSRQIQAERADAEAKRLAEEQAQREAQRRVAALSVRKAYEYD